ncbi:DUF1697 domain-containing protein [Stakelama tenebrarum]|uniref:DUF1697 domain-containing protein n=1 Tax=Stakelama tenebrarum TaxID=2711215 RepID=A0A6G6Y1P2_9SPHN|nr:DUF1697 domain-containing protein [Sphingosinithalassobacter tenebrarum]QIG78638.1 DUF1697 domain-containing protein [Sphingosinithalassobacter tenebrarum]
MTRWAALLRGVNVGGRKLAMADLRTMLAGMGFADVETLLASGNAVFSAAENDAARLERALEAKSAETLRLATDYLVRDADQWADVMAANPFPEVAAERPNQLLVLFHRDPFDPALLDLLAEHYDGPERLKPVGRELYIDFPNGQGRSDLVPMMTKLKFPKVATGRNWNTVTKITAKLGE